MSRHAEADDRLVGTVVQWNLAGWAMHQGDLGVAEALARHVGSRDPLPLAVTVNEVCSNQYELLAQALAELGYSAAPAWSIPDFDEPGCASFGNAVFWRGGDGGVEQLVYPDDAQVDGAATREKRTLVRAVSATLPLAVTATHLAAVADVATRQVAVAARWLAGRTAGPPTIVAGDLNLVPWKRALDVLYAGHQEADRRPRILARPTHRSLRKLDYVFVPHGRMRISSIGVAFRCRLSDHARVTVGVEAMPITGGRARANQTI